MLTIRTLQVVALHGAGLTNMIVMKPGSFVFEIMPTNPEVNICYLSMATKLKLRHVVVIQEAIHMENGGEVQIQRTIILSAFIEP
jgi:hypothetical protein